MYDADLGPKFIEFMPGIKDKQQSRKAKKFMCNFKLDGVVKTRDAPMVCQTLNGVFVEASSAQLAIEENSLCSFRQPDNGKDMPDCCSDLCGNVSGRNMEERETRRCNEKRCEGPT